MAMTPASRQVTSEKPAARARLDAPLGSASGLGPKLVGVDPPALDPYPGDAGAETTGLEALPKPAEGGDAGAAASAECATTRTIIRWPASQCPGTPLTK
jgi:hypothetical protein